MWEDTKIFQVLSIRFLLKLFFALLIYINIRVHTNLSKNGFCKKEKRRPQCFERYFHESLVDQQCRLIYWKIIRRRER